MMFEDFARHHGLVLDRAIADGRWHRVPTEDHSRKRNGAYVLDHRGGACQNWATMSEVAVWRPEEGRQDAPVARESSRDVRERLARAEAAQERRQQQARIEAQKLLAECQRLHTPTSPARASRPFWAGYTPTASS